MAKKKEMCNLLFGLLILVVLFSLYSFCREQKSVEKFVSLKTRAGQLYNMLADEQEKLKKKAKFNSKDIVEHLEPASNASIKEVVLSPDKEFEETINIDRIELIDDKSFYIYTTSILDLDDKLWNLFMCWSEDSEPNSSSNGLIKVTGECGFKTPRLQLFIVKEINIVEDLNQYKLETTDGTSHNITLPEYINSISMNLIDENINLAESSESARPSSMVGNLKTKLETCGIADKLKILTELSMKIATHEKLNMKALGEISDPKEREKVIVNAIISKEITDLYTQIVDTIVSINYDDLKRCFPSETTTLENHRGSINEGINNPLVWDVLKHYTPLIHKMINWSLKMLKLGLNNEKIRDHYITFLESIDARDKQETKADIIKEAPKWDLAKGLVGVGLEVPETVYN